MGTDTQAQLRTTEQKKPTQLSVATWASTHMRKVYISQNREIVVQK